jgi:hypothetical protein
MHGASAQNPGIIGYVSRVQASKISLKNKNLDGRWVSVPPGRRTRFVRPPMGTGQSWERLGGR